MLLRGHQSVAHLICGCHWLLARNVKLNYKPTMVHRRVFPLRIDCQNKNKKVRVKIEKVSISVFWSNLHHTSCNYLRIIFINSLLFCCLATSCTFQTSPNSVYKKLKHWNLVDCVTILVVIIVKIEKCRSQCFDTTFTILVVIIVKIIFICSFLF